MQRALITAVDFPSQGAVQMPPLLGALKQTTSRLPDPLAYMIEEAIDDFEGKRTDSDLERLRDALNNDVTKVCEAAVSNAYPFVLNSQRDITMQEFFAAFCAARGHRPLLFGEPLPAMRSRVALSGDGTPTARCLDVSRNETLKRFQLAAVIRDAFFPGGGGVPAITLTFDKTDMHRSIRTAVLQINGQIMTAHRAKRFDSPGSITWPGAGAGGSISLQFEPELRARTSKIEFNGAWSIIRFLQAGTRHRTRDFAQSQVRYRRAPH